jgi:hypothetical protein
MAVGSFAELQPGLHSRIPCGLHPVRLPWRFHQLPSLVEKKSRPQAALNAIIF